MFIGWLSKLALAQPENKKIYPLAIWVGLILILFLGAGRSVQAQFITRGDAVKLSSKCYKVTAEELNRSGSIWADKKIDLAQPFELTFIIYLGKNDANGADGIAFVLQNDSRGMDATGSNGSGLGYGADLAGGNTQIISPSVAIEFDTYFNGSDLGDIPEDHTAVVYNGKIDQPQLPPLSIDPNSSDVENQKCHEYKITWNPPTRELKLFFDGVERFNHKDDLINQVFRGSTEVYYGFTGSTGGSLNEQTVCIIDPDSEPIAQNDQANTAPYQPVLVPVLQNDSHTANEQIQLSSVLKAPAHGRASLTGDQITYTPNDDFIGTDTFTYEVCESGTEKCYTKCTTATVTVNVTCPPLLPVNITAAGPTEFCPGGSVALSVPVVKGATYRWQRNGQPTGSNKPELLATESGDYTIEVVTVCGSQPGLQPVAVQIINNPAAPLASGTTRCGPGSVNLTATGGTAGQYRWYTAPVGGTPLPGAVNNTFTSPALTTSTVYYVALTNGSCESARQAVPVTILPLPEITSTPEITIRLGEKTTLEATGGVSYKWKPATNLSDPQSARPVAQPEETTVYTVTATSADGCTSSAQVTVKVLLELIIPTAISPNGDGVNETWEIININRYPDARVQIFDRWGGKVYESIGYQNNWNGTRQGKTLPVGTYFYVITLNAASKLTGPLSIVL